MSTKTVEFAYRCSLERGWEWVRPTAKPSPVTHRAARFLPMLVEFLDRRPSVSDRVAVILQMREFKENGGTRTLGSLLSIQSLPFHFSSDEFAVEAAERSVEMWAPSLYVEEPFDEQKERERLANMLGHQQLPNAAVRALASNGWNIDVVLWLRRLDEGLLSEQTGHLVASVQAVEPPADYRVIEGVWSPGGRPEGGLAALCRCVCIPWLPPPIRYLGASKGRCVVYVLVGQGTRKALLDVSNVWRRPAARNILLAGEPGAGKDVAARLIHWGRARGSFQAVSVAGATWEDMEIPLLGEGQPGRPPILKGFVEEALGGTLLVDEIDKADRSVRDRLLRIVESDEFHRPNSGDRINISGRRRPLFVFAGSGKGPRMSKLMEALASVSNDREQQRILETWDVLKEPTTARERMEVEEPPDFWQRMDYKLELQHPYVTADGIDRDVFNSYVAFFFEQARSNVLAMKNESPFVSDRLLWLAFQAAEREIQSVWTEAMLSLQETLSRKIPGLRIIRSAATTLFEDLSARASDGALRGVSRSTIEDLARSAVEHVWGSQLR